MMNIENPMVTYREPKQHVYAVCRLCLRDILEGDDMYDMPDGAIICEDCLEEWAKDYRKEASWDFPYEELREGRELVRHGNCNRSYRFP